MLGTDIADFSHYGRDVGNPCIRCDVAAEIDLFMQGSALVVRPYFLAELHRRERRRRTTEIGRDVVDVPLQHARCIVVARRVDGLRQIDDHRTVAIDENVVLR